MIGSTAYIPRRGDVVWIKLDPQKGPEQRGHRPAVVLSRSDYNRKTRLAVICPITTKGKGYPFEVPSRQTWRDGSYLSRSNPLCRLERAKRNVYLLDTCRDLSGGLAKN